MGVRYFHIPQGYITADQLSERLKMKNNQIILRAINAGTLPACTFKGNGTRRFIKEEDAKKYEQEINTPQPVLVSA